MVDLLSSRQVAQRQGSETLGAHPTVSFYSSQDTNKTMRCCCPHSGWVSPLPSILSESTLKDTLRGMPRQSPRGLFTQQPI